MASANSGDDLIVKPFGGGQEVGRSCIMIKFKGKTILLDFGLHPAFENTDALPAYSYSEVPQVDLLLISHFHIDHCGGVPWLLSQSQFRGKCRRV